MAVEKWCYLLVVVNVDRPFEVWVFALVVIGSESIDGDIFPKIDRWISSHESCTEDDVFLDGE